MSHFYYYFTKDNLNGAQIVAAMPKRDTSFTIDAQLHTHDYAQIWYTLSGEYLHKILGRTYTMTRGTFMIIPPFFPHELIAAEDKRTTSVRIDMTVEFINKYFSTPDERDFFLTLVTFAETSSPLIHFSGDEMLRVESFLTNMFEYLRADSNKFLTLQGDSFREFWRFIMSRRKKCKQHSHSHFSRKYKEVVDSVLEYIEAHLSEKIMLSDLCEHIHLSESRMRAIFKYYTGNTIINYINELRIRRANKLMGSTNMSIDEVMRECGFQSRSYFNKLFKKHFGITPSLFLSRIKAADRAHDESHIHR